MTMDGEVQSQSGQDSLNFPIKLNNKRGPADGHEPMDVRGLLPDVRVATLVLLVGITGCSGFGRGDPFTGTTKATIFIEVDNRNFNQATVWMLSSSGQRRLGVVNGKVRKTFTIRWPRSDDLQLRVRVMGERGFTTARQLVVPGDHIELRIR